MPPAAGRQAKSATSAHRPPRYFRSILADQTMHWRRELFCSFCRSAVRRCGLRARASAACSYSSSDFVTNSSMPIAIRRLPATRPANVSPLQVTTGNPAHSASLAVVCALQVTCRETDRHVGGARDVRRMQRPAQRSAGRSPRRVSRLRNADCPCTSAFASSNHNTLPEPTEADPSRYQRIPARSCSCCETAKHQPFGRQSMVLSRRAGLRHLTPAVVHLIAAWKVYEFFPKRKPVGCWGQRTDRR